MGQTKEKIIAIIIFLIGGLSTWFLIFNQPNLLARSQSLGTLPLPLVFDSPKGYEFWANKYELTVHSRMEVKNIKIDKEFYANFPKNVVIFNSIAIPLVWIPIQEKYLWYPVVFKLFCNQQSKLLKYLPIRDKEIKKVEILIYNQKQKWEEEIKCL